MENNNGHAFQNQAAELFHLIFGQCSDGFLEVRAFHQDKTHQDFFSIPLEIAQAAEFAVGLQNEVFFGVAVRSEASGTANSVTRLPVFWVDADDNAICWTNFPLTPLAVVNSGHPSDTHFHGYYAVDAPLELATESDRGRALAFLRALCAAFKGDYRSCDLARVLRVPGTVNTKAGKPCVLMEVNQTAHYSLEQIRDAITDSMIAHHWQKGQRHDLALSLSGYLAKRQVPWDDAEGLLEKLLQLVGDDEQKDRFKALESSYDRLAKGARVRGYRGLAQYLTQEELGALDGLWGKPAHQDLGRHTALDGRVYCEKKGRIVVSYERGDAIVEKTLTSFTIEPDLRISVDGQAEFLRATLKVGQKEYPGILFKRESWNSKQKFMSTLPAVDLQFFGSDLDVQAILALVTDEELPMRKGTPVLGRNGDLWVLRDGVLSKEGWAEDPEIMYLPSEVDFDRRIQYPAVEDETRFVTGVIPLLLVLNEGKVIFPVLGWFFSTPFAPQIRQRLRHFPILVVWGTHGGGKSTLLRVLWECFGVKSELFSSTETPFTFLRLFSGTNSIPILIDEFKPFNMGEDEVRLLLRYLKRLYDGEVEHRGRPDLSLVAYRLQAPVAIAGEVSPCSLETAMIERVIQVNLNPDILTDDSPYVSALGKLAQLDLRAFAPLYIRWCLGANIGDLMSEARALLPKLPSAPGRVIDNLLVMVTGLVALRRFAHRYGIELKDHPFREGVEESVTTMVNELLQRGPRQEIGLTVFLETLATMAATARIKRGIHYATDDDTRLYIHLEDCLAEFRKFTRETNARIEVLDKNAYQKQIREVHARGGYISDPSTTHWFKAYETEAEAKGRVRRCVEIDLECLPFDTSGFEEPR